MMGERECSGTEAGGPWGAGLNQTRAGIITELGSSFRVWLDQRVAVQSELLHPFDVEMREGARRPNIEKTPVCNCPLFNLPLPLFHVFLPFESDTLPFQLSQKPLVPCFFTY